MPTAEPAAIAPSVQERCAKPVMAESGAARHCLLTKHPPGVHATVIDLRWCSWVDGQEGYPQPIVEGSLTNLVSV